MSSRFLADLERYYLQYLASDVLKGVREKAWDHFLELGLPDKKAESFRYVPLARLYETYLKLPSTQQFSFKEHIFPECQESYLVFVNGSFVKELSKIPPKLVVLPIVEAMRSYGTLLQNRWKKTLKEETDPFAILNLATHPIGLFVYAPPKLKLEAPIQTVFIGGKDFLDTARLQIFLAPEAELQWISTVVGDGVHHTLLDVSLDDASSFHQYEVPSSGEGWHLNYLRSTLKRNSELKHLNLSHGNRFTRHSLQAYLGGENGNALLQGLWYLKGNTQAHTHVKVEHAAPNAKSLQKFKGILDNTAQSSFEGKIYVHPQAQKTEAYQLNHNLLLSEGTIAQAKPNLEIFADDVKASHGATFAPVDEEQIFYLKSRGLSSKQATDLLVTGFVREIVDQIPIASVRKDVEQYVGL